MLNFVNNIEGGRWLINTGSNQMTFFEDDGTTVVAIFDLFDEGGNVTTDNVFERRRVT